MTFTRYLPRLLLVILASLATIMVFNYLVDPLGIYRVINKPGFNAIKSKVSSYRPLWKSVAITQANPDILLLGNSRTEYGINPDSPVIRSRLPAGTTLFNGALASANIVNIYRFAQHATATTQVHTLVIGLDFEQFKDRVLNTPFPAEPYLAVKEDFSPNPSARFNILRDSLLSVSMLRASFHTLTHQENRYNKFTTSGHSLNEHHFAKIAKQGTHLDYFAKMLSRVYNSSQDFIHGEDQSFDTGLLYLEKLLNLCQQKQLNCLFYFSPVHLSDSYVRYRAGEMPQIANWKRTVAKKLLTGENPSPLYDYSTLHVPQGNPEQTRMILDEPFEMASSQLQWFIDPTHFSSKQGDLILAGILAPYPAENLGVKVTLQNIEAIIAQDINYLEHYGSYQPLLYPRILELLESN